MQADQYHTFAAVSAVLKKFAVFLVYAKLGPTFLIKKTALDKAKNFINTTRLNFDMKIDQSNFLPSFRANKGKTFYSKTTPSEVQNKPQKSEPHK